MGYVKTRFPSYWLILLIFIVFITIIIFTKSRYTEKNQNVTTDGFSRRMPHLEFLPVQPYNSTCDDLFINTAAAHFNFTSNYRNSLAEFNSEINRVTGGRFSGDGHIAMFKEEHLALHYLASLTFVRNICETGFNYGHSSFSFLTANKNVVVHSFDIASHSYTRPMAEYLSKTFPGRFSGHFGDSTVTVPAFIREHPGHVCDFTFIDGGHIYHVANADLLNFRSISNKIQNLVAFDDYPTKLAFVHGSPHGAAWEEAIKNKNVLELMRCHRQHDHIRGFTVGSYLFN